MFDENMLRFNDQGHSFLNNLYDPYERIEEICFETPLTNKNNKYQFTGTLLSVSRATVNELKKKLKTLR